MLRHFLGWQAKNIDYIVVGPFKGFVSHFSGDQQGTFGQDLIAARQFEKSAGVFGAKCEFADEEFNGFQVLGRDMRWAHKDSSGVPGERDSTS